MRTAPLPAELHLLALALPGRFGAILASIQALIAARFLKNPRYLPFLVPLWSYIGRTRKRFARLLARAAEGRLPRPARPRATPREPAKTPAFRVPAAHAWLIRAIPNEAACCASQITCLLAEPGMAELLAATPGAGRLLRPLFRLLCITPPAALQSPPKPPRPKPIRPHTGTPNTGTPAPPPPEPARRRRDRWFWPPPPLKKSA